MIGKDEDRLTPLKGEDGAVGRSGRGNDAERGGLREGRKEGKNEKGKGK